MFHIQEFKLAIFSRFIKGYNRSSQHLPIDHGFICMCSLAGKAFINILIRKYSDIHFAEFRFRSSLESFLHSLFV